MARDISFRRTFSIIIAPLAWWQWAETAPLRRRFSLIQAALEHATEKALTLS